MKRTSKTFAQQNKYYEVDNIYDYIIESYINGNFSQAKRIYKELKKEYRKQFISYILEMIPTKAQQIINTIM